MTASGIEPATVGLVVQCLNQLHQLFVHAKDSLHVRASVLRYTYTARLVSH